MDKACLHFFVEGRVQGVGFRRFVLKRAQLLSLSGWVQNTFDHRVEVLAFGKESALSSLLQACQKGPLFSSVTSVVLEDDCPNIENPPCLEGEFIIKR